jgi:hypothetical protein
MSSKCSYFTQTVECSARQQLTFHFRLFISDPVPHNSVAPLSVVDFFHELKTAASKKYRNTHPTLNREILRILENKALPTPVLILYKNCNPFPIEQLHVHQILVLYINTVITVTCFFTCLVNTFSYYCSFSQ